VLFQWDPFSTNILTEFNGLVEYIDIKENETYKEEMDETTGRRHRIIVDSKNRKLNPRISVIDTKTAEFDGRVKLGYAKVIVQSKSDSKTYMLPYGYLTVKEGTKVKKGTALSHNVPDIKAGISGVAKFRTNKNRKKEIVIKGDLKEKAYLIPSDHVVLVKDGDKVDEKTVLTKRTPLIATEIAGEVALTTNDDGFAEIEVKGKGKKESYIVPDEQLVIVKDGDKVKNGDVLTEFNEEVVSEIDGTVKLGMVEIIVEKAKLRKKYVRQEGYSLEVDHDQRVMAGTPLISKRLASYILPVKARLIVDDKDTVKPGDVLVKLPREILKSRDITGGLPRVAELFEARKPKDPAVVTEIDGTVKFGSVKRGIREIIIISTDGKTKKNYLIPYGKHVLVHDGDYVDAGERLSEGAVAPHDILRIKGANAVQEYLVNEIQEVYRLQGVRINDKHIEIIVRQMMQRVRIEDPGDTNYLEGDLVDKQRFIIENERIAEFGIVEDKGDSKYEEGDRVEMFEIERQNERLLKQEKNPVKFRPARAATFVSQLLGITQAALSTESFISSASFQETTKVLTEAAIEGKVDHLRGLKENVIIGHLIPAGTGIKLLDNIEVISDADKEELEEKLVVEESPEIQEQQSVEEQL